MTKLWKDKPEPTVEIIRKELRDALFAMSFHLTCADPRFSDIESTEAEFQQKAGKLVISKFCEFGIGTKLMSPQEGNDWLNAIFERPGAMNVAEILEKYDG